MFAMIITSLLVMTAAIIIRGIFRKKSSGKILMILWAVVFIKLAVPVNIPSDFSVMNVIPSVKETESAGEAPREAYTYDNNAQTHDTAAYPEHTAPAADTAVTATESKAQEAAPVQPAPEKKKTDLKETANRVYIIVTVLLEAAVIAAYIICAVRFSGFEKADVPESLAEKGLRFRKGNIDTPAVFGIFRPLILIPSGTDLKDSVTLRHIILHEKTHIRHRDQLWNFLTLMICCLNWYDPLAWVCRVLYLKDTEKWCDESVIKLIGGENRKSYAESLLACAAERSRPFMLLSGFGESDIKGRIKAIMSNRKLRKGAAVAAVILTVITATAFGTGKAIRAEMTDVGFVPYSGGKCYVQRFTGNSGEKAEVRLILNHIYRPYGQNPLANYHRFILETDSEDYTIADARAVITADGVKAWRTLPDGERAEENSLVYNTDFDKETNDFDIYIEFDPQVRYSFRADVTYTLKKGAFTVGTYTISADYAGQGSNFADYIDNFNYRREDGFVAEIINDRYEIRCTDGSTDLIIAFDDERYGDIAATVIRPSDGKEFYLDWFDPYHGSFDAFDITGDGVNELIVTAYITGTGIADNKWTIIDGAKLCEIPVDTETTAQMVQDYICSEKFAAILPEDIFPNRVPWLITSGLHFPYYKNGSVYLNVPLIGEKVRAGGGLQIWPEGNKITGDSAFILIQGDDDDRYYSEIYSAKFDYAYEDGMMKPVNMRTPVEHVVGGYDVYEEPVPVDEIVEALDEELPEEEMPPAPEVPENGRVYEYNAGSPPEMPEFKMPIDSYHEFTQEEILRRRLMIKAMFECSATGEIPYINYIRDHSISSLWDCTQLENVRVTDWEVKDEKFYMDNYRYELIVTLDVAESGSEFVPVGKNDYTLVCEPGEDRMFLPLRKTDEYDESVMLPFGGNLCANFCTYYTAYFGDMFAGDVITDLSSPVLPDDSYIGEAAFYADFAMYRAGGLKDKYVIPYDEFDSEMKKILGFSADALRIKEGNYYNADDDCIHIDGRGTSWLCGELAEDIYDETAKTHTVTVNYYKDDFYLVLSQVCRYTVRENDDGTYSMLKIEHLYKSDNPILGGCT